MLNGVRCIIIHQTFSNPTPKHWFQVPMYKPVESYHVFKAFIQGRLDEL